jgi:hypothetical protein
VNRPLAWILLILSSSARGDDQASDRVGELPGHRCARYCVGPCLKGGPLACDCDGRRCLIRLVPPDGGDAVLTRVEIEGLPLRATPCADRPLTQGRTQRRVNAYFWTCNDPECPFCADDNEAFRAVR